MGKLNISVNIDIEVNKERCGYNCKYIMAHNNNASYICSIFVKNLYFRRYTFSGSTDIETEYLRCDECLEKGGCA